MIKMCDSLDEKTWVDAWGKEERWGVWSRPRQLWIACTHREMDSALARVCQQLPAMVLRQERGTLPAEEAAERLIQWALDELGVVEVVLCGHSCCSDPREQDPAVERGDWIQRVRDRERMKDHARNHLIQQLASLKSLPAVSAAMRRDALSVHGLFYLTESGVFTVYDEHAGQFEAL